MMTHKEAYVFGWVYGKFELAVRKKSKRGLEGITDPSARPLSASALAIQKANTLHAITPEIDKEIAEAYSHITYIDDEEKVLPLEKQGTWFMGYHHALAGMPLNLPDGIDIEAKRRALHLSQAQLAEMVGVTQAQISRWETGQDQPSKENAEKLKSALGY